MSSRGAHGSAHYLFRSGFQLRMRVMAETLAPSTDWLIEGPQVNTRRGRTALCIEKKMAPVWKKLWKSMVDLTGRIDVRDRYGVTA